MLSSASCGITRTSASHSPSPVPGPTARGFSWSTLLLAAALAGVPFGVTAQEADGAPSGEDAAADVLTVAGDTGVRPGTRAARLPAGFDIEVDGRLGEEGWDLAEPITSFRQQEPIEGGDPTEPTEIRILFDAEALYIGALLHDSDPDGILAYQLERDAGLGTDDRFMWILDTFQDGRTGYFFETNPAGLLGDGLIGGGGGINKSWDGIWEVRTAVVDEGWSVEIRIPFSTLNFDPQRDTWGINFQRTIRRRNEEILWSGWRRNESLFRPAQAGEVTGLTGLSQGLGIEIKPYLAASGGEEVQAETPWEGDTKVGMDLTYSVTPSLRAALTVNTDFAEVEVDDRRVNLTRFPLRFPEQRDFFLEGSGVFSFNWADPFFSRRIGLVEGQAVPIRFGARLGGQVGAYELGLYQVRTGDAPPEIPGAEPVLPSEDFTAARLRRGLFSQSQVGAIYTRRATSPDASDFAPPARHTVGMDADFYTSEWLGRYNAQIEGFMVYHTDPVDGGQLIDGARRARGLRINFPNDLIRFHHSFRDFGEGWDPALGFAQRRGFRRHQPSLVVAPRPERWESVRQLPSEIRFEYLTDLDNVLLDRNLDFSQQVQFESGDQLQFGVGRGFERLRHAFTIHGSGDDAIVISPGEYEVSRWSVGGRTAGYRMLSAGLDFERSDFWSGRRNTMNLRGTVRPARGISLSADYERNEVRLQEGDFDTNLVRLVGDWNLNPRTSFTSNIQYDDVSRVVGLFARMRWIVRPGSEVFLVWSHNWQERVALADDRGWSTLSRGGALKVNYSYRF